MNKVIWKHKVLSKFSIFRWNFDSKQKNCKVFNTFDQLFKVRVIFKIKKRNIVIIFIKIALCKQKIL